MSLASQHLKSNILRINCKCTISKSTSLKNIPFECVTNVNDK